MSLRFLADQCVPLEIVTALRRAGHHVTLLREALQVSSPDPVVLAQAQELGRILLSLNGDFADIVAYPPGSHLGIIAIQLHNHPETIPPLMERLLAFLGEHLEQGHFHGKLFIAEVHRIRVRG